MLDSFVSTQKLSVQKALARKFRKFLVAKADFDQLALYKLQVPYLYNLPFCPVFSGFFIVKVLPSWCSSAGV